MFGSYGINDMAHVCVKTNLYKELNKTNDYRCLNFIFTIQDKGDGQLKCM